MLVLVFAMRPAPEEAIIKLARERHPRDKIGLIEVRHATPSQVVEALRQHQPDVVYTAEPGDTGELRLGDVALGPPSGPPAATRPADPPPDPSVRAQAAALVVSRLASADPDNPDGRPTRSSLRRAMSACFVEIELFDAFIKAHFPAVFRNLSPQMNRQQKANELLARIDSRDLLARLIDLPEFAGQRGAITYELTLSRLDHPSGA